MDIERIREEHPEFSDLPTDPSEAELHLREALRSHDPIIRRKAKVLLAVLGGTTGLRTDVNVRICLVADVSGFMSFEFVVDRGTLDELIPGLPEDPSLIPEHLNGRSVEELEHLLRSLDPVKEEWCDQPFVDFTCFLENREDDELFIEVVSTD